MALGIGGLFTGKGVPSYWYANLNKAPWTPPGWMFGAAWTTIMLCFSFYLAYVWPKVQDKKMLVGLLSVQWILNVMWNPVFFYFHKPLLALLIIVSLTLLIGFILSYYYPNLKEKSILLLPYLIWLVIATSLNAYIVLRN
jgi:benzodiazapine receptor